MMTLMDLPPHYSGIGRLFPLKNNVLFPAVLQSVQVSDTAGIKLVEHALTGDRLVAFATQLAGPMKPGKSNFPGTDSRPWSPKNPPVYRMVCLARIVEHEENKNGIAMSVLGIRRAWIRREVPTEKVFRMADLQILEPNEDDSLLPLDVEDRADLTKAEKDHLFERLCLVEFCNRELRKSLQTCLPDLFATAVSMQQLLDAEKSLESLTDLTTHLLRLPVSWKLQQLQTLDSVLRAQRLLALFRQLSQPIGTDSMKLGPPLPTGQPGVASKVPIESEKAANKNLINIAFQSVEFEITVQRLEDKNRQETGTESEADPAILDDSVQDYPQPKSESERDDGADKGS